MLNQSSNIFVDAYTGDRSGIIMLCDCIPDDLGDAQQQRAWDIISQLHHDTDIHLIMTAKTSLNLLLWRRLNDLTASIELLPKFSLSRRAHIRQAIQQAQSEGHAIYCQNLSMLPADVKSDGLTIIYDHCHASRKLKRYAAKRIADCNLVLASNNTCRSLPHSMPCHLELISDTWQCVEMLKQTEQPVSIDFSRAKAIMESQSNSDELLSQAA